MKRIFFGAALLSLAVPAFAGCIVGNTTSENVRQIVVKHGGWPISDTKCALLSQYHYDLLVEGDATVLDGISVAYVTLHLMDPDTGQVSDLNQSQVSVHRETASIPFAEDKLFESLAEAIEALDFKKAAGQITVKNMNQLIAYRRGFERGQANAQPKK